MRYRLSETEARRIASKFVSDKVIEREQESGPSKYLYEPMCARPDQRRAGKWVVLFTISTVAGGFVDGPTIVLVDDATAEAHFAESP